MMKQVVRNAGFPAEMGWKSVRTVIIDGGGYNEIAGGGLEKSGW